MPIDYLVTDTELSDIADAIRAKGGASASISFPNGFTTAIAAIPTGITPTGTKQISITQNGTVTEDVANYANAEIAVNVSGGGGGWISVSPYFVRIGRDMPMGAAMTFVAIKAATNTVSGLTFLYSESAVCQPGTSVTFTDLAMIDGQVFISLIGNTQDAPLGVYGLGSYEPQECVDLVNGNDRLFEIATTEDTVMQFM